MSEIGDATTPIVPSFSRFLALSRKVIFKADPTLLIILALPWALFWSGNNWIFDHMMMEGSIDPWIYFGFFQDLPVRLHTFPATYYGSRLSWILPGYVVYALFPPIVAAYVLHIGLYYAAVVSLYFTVKVTLNHKAALLSALFMGCHGYFLLAVGQDYVDGAGLTYFCLTTAALTYAAKKQRPWIWLCLSGALYGAMVYSQLFLVVFTPPLLMYHVVLNRIWRRQQWMLGLLFSVLGFVAISVLLGAINYGLGGTFLFFSPSVRFAFELLGSPNPWKQAFAVWRQAATWAVLPGLMLFSSLVFVFTHWKNTANENVCVQLLFQAYFLVCALIMIVFEVAGSPVFEYSYYASFLMPSIFLALAAQVAPLTERLSTKTFVFLSCSAIAAFFLTLLIPLGSRFTQWSSAHASRLLLLLVVVGTVLILTRSGSPGVPAFALWFLAVGLVNIPSGSHRATNSSLSKQGFQAVVQGVEALRSAESSEELLFWYSVSEPEGQYYRDLASTRLWGYRLINERFPSIERGPDSFQTLAPRTRLVVISNDNDAFQQASGAIRTMGLGAELVEERRIQEGPIGWNMYFIRVHGWPQITGVQLTADGWPERLALRLETGDEQSVSLMGGGARTIFQSDMNDSAEWQVNRYGSSGGLSIESNCFSRGESCGLYSSGDPRDHLASPYVSLLSEERVSVFFAIWVKPLKAEADPKIVLQDERFATVVESEVLSSRSDGWTLRGAWLNHLDAQRVRVVVTEPAGSSSLLDKALLLEMPSEPAIVSAESNERRAPER